MNEVLPGLLDLFNTLFFIGFFCCFPLLIIGGILYSTYINLAHNRLAHQKLAQALGYVQLNPANHILKTWFGGLYQNRAVAITTYGSTYRYYSGDRSRVGVQFILRIAMEVQTDEIPGLLIRRTQQKGIPQTFEDAFEQHHAGFLSHAARNAMLAFVYKGYPTGLNKALAIRFVSGIRNLTYRPRAEGDVLPPEVLPHARMILVHEYPDAGLSPEKFRALLDDMCAVAQAIETGIAPPSSAQITPPVEGMGKYLPWGLAGLLIFGLPALICVCSMTYTFLASYR